MLGATIRMAPDMCKTSSLIGYESQVTLHIGIVKTYEGYRKFFFGRDLKNVF
jgi:hypothetical protein